MKRAAKPVCRKVKQRAKHLQKEVRKKSDSQIMSFSDIKPLKETGQHSYHRRAFNHDYYAPFIYHIILKKKSQCESFGSVDGDARIAPGKYGSAKILESSLGKCIAKALLHLPHVYPIIKLHQFCVMPDHVHILLQVLYRSELHLDYYIDSIKKNISIRYSKEKDLSITENMIFESGYCDKPLYDNRSLNGLYTYIRENPHRLAIRLQFPQFFTRCRKLRIGDKEYEAYGNLFLFRNPDKNAVKVSRKFSIMEKETKKSQWLSNAQKGTVLVSPFISKEEKLIRAEAESMGANIILIIHESLSERYKPAAHDFRLCEQGRLLIISMGLPTDTDLSRAHCIAMNSLAEEISSLS